MDVRQAGDSAAVNFESEAGMDYYAVVFRGGVKVHSVAIDIGTPRGPLGAFLAEERFPEWFLVSRSWDEYDVVGEWKTRFGTYSTVMRIVCRDRISGGLFILEGEAESLSEDLVANTAMASAMGIAEAEFALKHTVQEAFSFLNSSLPQFHRCVITYSEFSSGERDPKEVWMSMVKIDPGVGTPHSFWFSNSAEFFLDDDEG
jgi:hypothetical protein